MIIKILPSSSNFPAIDYNDRKTLEGKSELLEIANFEGLGHVREELTRSDYINYITSVAGLNDRVRNRQFHAVISTRGRSCTPAVLKDVAVQYLKKMGFGKNPYMIYAHTDTENTHVHLISSLVGKQGNRVDRTYEWLRSQEAIHEILQRDPRREARQAIAKALGYNFSSKAQFSLLLAQEGFKTRDKPLGLEVIKYGRVVGIFKTQQVEEKVNAYVPQETRENELRELFYTFMPGLDLKGFAGFMQQQFAVDIILHPWKKRTISGDYSIIDHGGGNVFRGEQVMDITELASVTTLEEKLAKAKKCVLEMIGENIHFSGLRKKMSGLGFDVSREGTIRVKGTTKPCLQITRERLKRLRYNDRLVSASCYARAGSREAELLARLFMVRPYELTSGKRKINSGKYYTLFEKVDPARAEEMLAAQGIMLIKYSGNLYLIDEKEKAVIMVGDEASATKNLGNITIRDLGRERIPVPDDLDYLVYKGADTLENIVNSAYTCYHNDVTRSVKLSL